MSAVCFQMKIQGEKNEWMITLYSDNNSYISSDLLISAVEFFNFLGFVGTTHPQSPKNLLMKL